MSHCPSLLEACIVRPLVLLIVWIIPSLLSFAQKTENSREVYYVDHQQDVQSQTDILGMYHKKENCDYIVNKRLDCSMMRLDKIQQKKLRACPYCIGDKTYKFKTTYIPKYYSCLNYSRNNAVESAESHERLVEIPIEDYAIITIEHEPVDKEKIENIKTAHTMQNWAAFSQMVSEGASLYGALSKNRRISMMGNVSYVDATRWLNYAEKKADDEESLYINTTIFNNSSEDIIVYEIKRGLVWPIRPNHKMTIYGINVFDLTLRIDHDKVYSYVNVAACNYLIKNKPLFATDDYWIVRTLPEDEMLEHMVYSSGTKNSVLYRVSKNSYKYDLLTEEEFEEIKKKNSK